MVAVTYGVARVTADKAAGRTQATAPRKSFFARFMDALVESRLQHVHREIARHAHLLPHTFDEKGKRLVKPNIDTPRSAAGSSRFTSEAAPVIPGRGGFVFGT